MNFFKIGVLIALPFVTHHVLAMQQDPNPISLDQIDLGLETTQEEIQDEPVYLTENEVDRLVTQRIRPLVQSDEACEQLLAKFRLHLQLERFHPGDSIIDHEAHTIKYAKDCIERIITKFLNREGILSDEDSSSDSDMPGD